MTTHAACDWCELTAFEPKPCTDCVKEGATTLRLCSECRAMCAECGESVCPDHRKGKASAYCAGCWSMMHDDHTSGALQQ